MRVHRAFALLKIVWEGEAPAEPQAMESVIFPAAQQELRPPENPPSGNKLKPCAGPDVRRQKTQESLSAGRTKNNGHMMLILTGGKGPEEGQNPHSPQK